PVNLFAATRHPPPDPDPPRSDRRDASGLLAPVVSQRAASGRRVVVPVAAPLPKRFFLWVDGVGGYLVCLSPRVTFGQATAEGPIDVPLFADVSRLHAEVT